MKRDSGSSVLVMGAALIGLALLYALSIGPVMRLAGAPWVYSAPPDPNWIGALYAPLFAARVWRPGRVAIDAYLDLWGAR